MEAWETWSRPGRGGSGWGVEGGWCQGIGCPAGFALRDGAGRGYILAQNTGKISSAKPQHCAWSRNHERMKPGMTHSLGECYTSQHCSLPSIVQCTNSQSIFSEHICPFKLCTQSYSAELELESIKANYPSSFFFQLGVFHLKVVMGK